MERKALEEKLAAAMKKAGFAPELVKITPHTVQSDWRDYVGYVVECEKPELAERAATFLQKVFQKQAGQNTEHFSYVEVLKTTYWDGKKAPEYGKFFVREYSVKIGE